MKISNLPYKTLLFFLLYASVGYSQNIISEEIALQNKEIVLPGTLRYTEVKEPIPLAIFIHGSGNVDRNGNQPGSFVQANYIKILADSLITRNIAFYSYDKRTATPSNLEKIADVDFMHYVQDAKIAIDHFKNDKRFSGIHILGHSQGSLVGMLAVSDDVKSYTSIAGPSTSIDQTIIAQLRAQDEAYGDTAKQYFEELKKTDTIQEVNPFLLQLFAPKNQKFLSEWMRFKPVEEIKKLELPMLIVQGDADIQIAVKDAENLKKAQPNAELEIIPKMNHMLKTVTSLSENNASYSDPSFPLSSQLVTHLCEFIDANK